MKMIWILYGFFVISTQFIHEIKGKPSFFEEEIDENLQIVSGVTSCGKNSVCGYLQVNPKGINHEKICKCASGICPNVWDSFDGKSITQGYDQYKFCGKAPKLNLCEPLMTAYSSKTIYSKKTEEKIAQIDRILCYCPETHRYDLAGTPSFINVGNDMEVVDVSYICSSIPNCGKGDVCKFVSETPTSYMVNRKCQCGQSLFCPTEVHFGKTETIAMGSGLVHSIRCQNQNQIN